ncbi:MAG TPA: glutamyl-tRNA reductase, partial [Candidatus Brocadiia bacterium]|nr:glutamyl-tRNA reductase [Candidatus Brocadiia bacterium]
MRLAVAGASHKTAGIDTRERLAAPCGEVGAYLSRAREALGGGELVLLRTCHRVELYVHAAAARVRGDGVARLVGSLAGQTVRPGEVYQFEEAEAASRLFRVAVGLDSAALGETQIQGQVQEAYETSARLGFAGPALHRLFQSALGAAGRARRETGLDRRALSIPALAATLAARLFDGVAGKTILLVGAGAMGELLIQEFRKRGAGVVMAASRRRARAEALAARYGGVAVGLEEMPERLADSDIVVSASSAPHLLIHRHDVEAALRRRPGPLFLIDLASPRDVDPAVADLPGAHLYNLDDLSRAVAERRRELASAAQAA